jgi:hypothetical protein
MPKSEIGEVPNDYLQCYRCNYIFKVSNLKEFHKLAADNFSPEELEFCRDIIPDSKEIEKLVKSK